MRVLTSDRIDSFIANLASIWDLRLPILLPDGTRVIGSLDDGVHALHGGAVSGKPTAAFFPQQGEIFTVSEGAVSYTHLTLPTIYSV